jgi:hypothetical protein
MAAAGGFDLVRRSRYLLLICLMLLCFQMVSTLIDFQFQHVMEQGFALKDERTAFYGTFTLVLNLASLGFQIFFTSWIHRNHGLGPSLILLPLAGILGGFGFFLFPVFWMGCGLRWAFGTLDYSLDRATRELLYLPTSREVKYKAKAFIDMFCFRFFRSLAGIVILIVQSFKGLAIQNLSLAVMFFCGVWLVVARWTRRENLRQLRQTLLGSLEPAVPVPDVGIEKLAETLLEIGFELQRLQETLALPGQGAKTLGEKSIQRLLELAGQLFGPSDVAGAVRALDGPEASRALALELLDGIGDVRIGLPLFRVLDPQRAPGEKPALVSLLLKRIGTLPRRPEEREVWTAAPPRKPRDEKSEMD